MDGQLPWRAVGRLRVAELAEVRGCDGHRRSLQKASSIMVDYVAHVIAL
jgi:hypothetical protein